MSGQRNKKPSDVIKARQEYLDNLSLEVQLNDANEQAVKQYKDTGQVPPISQMKDTRSVSQVLADLEKLKITLIKDLEPVADPQFAQQIIQRLIESPLNIDNTLLIFTAQRIEEIVKNLKKMYKYGIKGDANDADAFVSFIHKFFIDKNNTTESIKSYMNRTGQISGNERTRDYRQLLTQVYANFNSIYRSYFILVPKILRRGAYIPMAGGMADVDLIFDSINRTIDNIGYKMTGLLELFPTYQELQSLNPSFQSGGTTQVQFLQALDTFINSIIATPEYDGAVGEFERYLYFINHNIPNLEFSNNILSRINTLIQNINENLMQNIPIDVLKVSEQIASLMVSYDDLIDVDIAELADIVRIYNNLKRLVRRGGFAPAAPPGGFPPGGFPPGGFPPGGGYPGGFPPGVGDGGYPGGGDGGDGGDGGFRALPPGAGSSYGNPSAPPFGFPPTPPTYPVYNPSAPYRYPSVGYPSPSAPPLGGDYGISRYRPSPSSQPPMTIDFGKKPMRNITITDDSSDDEDESKGSVDEAETKGEDVEKIRGNIKQNIIYLQGVVRLDTTIANMQEVKNLIKESKAVISNKQTPTKTLIELRRRQRVILHANGFMGGSGLRQMSGRGLTRADYTQGIDPSPRYIKFGRYMINNKKLNDNVLSLRRSRGSTIATIPATKMTSELGGVIKKIVGGGIPSFDELNALSDAEKRYLFKVSQEADIYDKIKIPTPSKDEEEKDIHAFNVMKGEILAGNNSKELVSKFKGLLNKLSRSNVLPKSQVREILEELLELGY